MRVIILLLPTVILPVAMIGIGLKIIQSRKPIILSERRLFYLIVLPFMPIIIKDIWVIISDGFSVFSQRHLFISIIYSVMPVVFWVGMKGYVVLGTTKATFRNALHFALNKLDIKFEETTKATIHNG